jgi:hypothetical protein
MSEEKTSYYATLSYDSAYSADLKKLCQKLGIKQKDFLEKSISFFQRSGLDPREPYDVSSQLKPTENRLIGFLKIQDRNAQVHFENLEKRMHQMEKNQTDLLLLLSNALKS